MIFLDGVFVDDDGDKNGQRFKPVTQHQASEIVELAHEISVRLAGYLQRAGLIEGDAEIQYLAEDALNVNEMCGHQGYSVNYRISVGPPVSTKRLSLTVNCNIRYELKTPYRDGTTHIIFEPLDFISKLAALVPAPRVNLTRYHGVFAPNSSYRAEIIIKRQDKVDVTRESLLEGDNNKGKKRAAMTWAPREVPAAGDG